MRVAILITSLVALSATVAGAETYLVNPDGTGDFPTIQAAIDAASPGDIIELTDGTFTGDDNRDIDFLGKAICVRSASGDPGSCIIDCQGSMSSPHRGFRFHSGETNTTKLTGITITNGYATTNGGGVSCTSGSAPLISDCNLIHNSAGENGGALYCTSNSDLTLDNCLFIDNTAEIYGGAIRCYRSSPSLNSCLFSGNSGPFGGGFSCYRDCEPELTDCSFEVNASQHGGGMYSFDSAAILTRCTFADNLSLGDGGGIANFDSSPRLTGCVFTDNTALDVGGGFYAGGAGASTITGSTFMGNASPLGGGVYAQFTTLTLTSCTFANNTADVDGSGIYLAYADAELDRVIVAFGQGAMAIHCADANSVPVLSCCDIFGNTHGDWTDCIADQLGGNGNISADPLFCNLPAGDITLRPDSPCAPEYSSGCGLIGAWPVMCSDPTHADYTPIPDIPVLLQNHPNPFNPVTTIKFSLPEPQTVSLTVYSLDGCLVKILVDEVMPAGQHEAIWKGRDDNGRRVATGTYLYRLQAGAFSETKRMLLLK